MYLITTCELIGSEVSELRSKAVEIRAGWCLAYDMKSGKNACNVGGPHRPLSTSCNPHSQLRV
jgi:hypothetical protein